MRHFFKTICLALFAPFIGLFAQAQENTVQSVTSPYGNLILRFELADGGAPRYSLLYIGKVVVKPSGMGLRLKDGSALVDYFRLVKASQSEKDETWKPVWGGGTGANLFQTVDEHPFPCIRPRLGLPLRVSATA